METVVKYIFLIFFVSMLVLSLYGFVKKNYGIVLFSYLAVSFKTNMLDEFDIQFFEAQYIIAMLWLSLIFLRTRPAKPIINKTNKTFLNYIILITLFPILAHLKEYIFFGTDFTISAKTLTKTYIDILVVYSLFKYLYYIKIDKKYIALGIVIGSSVIGLQSILSHFILGYVGVTGVESNRINEVIRIAGFIKQDVNMLTTYLTLPLFFILTLTQKNIIKNIGMLIPIIIILLATLLTASRTGFLAIGLAALFFIYSKKNIMDPRYIFFSVLIIITGIFVVQHFGSQTFDRIQGEKFSENIRVHRWLEYFSLYFQNPIILLTGTLSELSGPLTQGYSLHNSFIQVLHDFGLLAVALVLLLIKKLYAESNLLSRLALLIYLFYSITLSYPPLGYLVFIIYYYNTYIPTYSKSFIYDNYRRLPNFKINVHT